MADTPDKPVIKEESELPPILVPLKEAFSHLFGFNLNEILSLGEPEIREEAEKLATIAKKKFPANHWIRSKIAERIVAVLTAKLEKSMDKQSPTVKALMEKFTDFVDNFTANFYGGRVEDKKTQRPDPGVTPHAHADLTKKFLESARLRQKRAKPEELTSLNERLLEEAKTISKLDVILTEGEPTETPAPAVRKRKVSLWKRDIGKWLGSAWQKTSQVPKKVWHARTTKSTNKELAKWLKQHQARYGTEEEKAQHDEFGRYLESPLSILGGLAFGFGNNNIWRPWWMKTLLASAVLVLAISWYWGIHH